MEKACQIIINEIINGKIVTRRDLEIAKRKVCRDYDLPKFMSNTEILECTTDEEREIVSNVLRKKPTRTISGVAIVAVMCHPHECPHGRCFYCPESDVAPPSYTGEEPAALRARMFKFHPYDQTYNRLKQLSTVGHPIDKVELIIMGGTFPSRESSYQEWFISQCLKAMNDFGVSSKENSSKGDSFKENSSKGYSSKGDNSKVYNSKKYDIKEDSLKNGDSEEYDPKKKSKGDSFKKVKTYPPYDYVILEDVQKANENAKVRCIGMTFETRPDFCKIEDVNRMLKMGVTRVELGVQTLYDDIYEKMERGHTIQDVINANQILRDSGIKVAMHLMPGYSKLLMKIMKCLKCCLKIQTLNQIC